MKRLLVYLVILAGVWSGSAMQSAQAQIFGKKEALDEDRPEAASSKLNNKRLEKNIDRFAAELDLSKRQEKQLKKIDRRYGRYERKLARKDGKRRDRRELAAQKRTEIIEVLTPEQQQRLEALTKKGKFSLDQIFGR